MMISRSHRTRRVAAVSLVAVALIGGTGSCALPSSGQRADYCAIMPDSVGLYVNNPVTQMGYQIGEITAITATASYVRVNFTVTEQRQLPQEVKAVTRANSILADRALELVGNYESGPTLTAGECIPLDRSSTPKSLSEVIGSATTFLNSINPETSNNIGDVVNAADRAIANQGPRINKLLTTSSALLDSPNQAIGDIASIVTNLAQLTSTLAALEPTLKQVLSDVNKVGPDVLTGSWGAVKAFEGLTPLIGMIGDIEKELGGEIQQTLDTVSVAVRKLTPRAPFYASILNVMPRLINGLGNLVNTQRFTTLRYRPPLYRIATPDGVLACNIMNARAPGSCANVNGTPYAVDVALLQYVLTQASQ